MNVSERKKLLSEYRCKFSGKQDLGDNVNIFKIKVEIDYLDNANFFQY
ncbi:MULTISPECIES: hypothetical protein [Xenorhabdus]|nr:MULTISPECIES: hypothetical protein [Xenorhabdus]MBC8946754.1 acyl carrier protein [Xenorhabdus indica]